MGFETAKDIRNERVVIDLFCRHCNGEPEYQEKYSCFDAVVSSKGVAKCIVEAKCRPGIYTKYPDGLKVSLHKWNSLISEGESRGVKPVFVVYDELNRMLIYIVASVEVVDYLVTLRRKYDGAREPAVFVSWSKFRKVAVVRGAYNAAV